MQARQHVTCATSLHFRPGMGAEEPAQGVLERHPSHGGEVRSSRNGVEPLLGIRHIAVYPGAARCAECCSGLATLASFRASMFCPVRISIVVGPSAPRVRSDP